MLIPRINSVSVASKTFSPSAITPRHNQKDKKMLTIDIPKDVTFDLPQGRFRAHLSKLKPYVKQHVRGPQDWLRILFEVDVPGLSDRVETMAGRSFKQDFKTGTELRTFLTGLLGKEFFQQNSGGKVSLDSLEGTECEVVLEHHQDDRYDKPLVIVKSVHPVTPVTAVQASPDNQSQTNN